MMPMETNGPPDELKAYLARIRKTIADSDSLVAQAELRIAETDRMLEKQGLTREQVMNFHFTEAQREAVNAELKRRGMKPLEEDALGEEEAPAPSPFQAPAFPSSASNADLAERQRKFGMMMKPFQI